MPRKRGVAATLASRRPRRGTWPGGEEVCAVARPKKQQQEARSERLNLRLQPDERADIEARAVALGITPSDYARRLVIGGRLASVVAKKADPSLVLAINRAGVNLNQIARTMNSGAGHVPLDLADTLERINRLLDRLQEDE